MNDNEREMDLALAEAEQENRLLRARNERLERELAGQVALNKMAENARELGLDYEPAPVQDLPFGVGGGLVAIKTLLGRDPCVHANTAIEMIDAILKEHPAAQPAVQEGRDWSLLEATQESLREHMAEIKRLKAAQPAPVQEPVALAVVGEGEWGEWVIGQQFETNNPPNHEYWENRGYLLVPLYTTPPAAQKPWVGLTNGEMHECAGEYPWTPTGLKCARAIEAKLKEKNT
jgi:hypothetical protein